LRSSCRVLYVSWLYVYIAMPDQYDAVQEFEQFLREQLPN
jgi:hypothetical protein